MFYDLLSLVTIPLVTHYADHESSFAGRKYAAYTIGGASLAFFTVVMTSIYNGAGNFLYGGNLYGPYDPGLMQLVFLFGFFGFGVKAAVFPLHSWLPTASVAPTPVTALLHAVAVVIILRIILRIRADKHDAVPLRKILTKNGLVRIVKMMLREAAEQHYKICIHLDSPYTDGSDIAKPMSFRM
jgi:formate hydrogenlyase subunit 3/multisubunit Na+/H+ antiporter MnhD subunit